MNTILWIGQMIIFFVIFELIIALAIVNLGFRRLAPKATKKWRLF